MPSRRICEQQELLEQSTGLTSPTQSTYAGRLKRTSIDEEEDGKDQMLFVAMVSIMLVMVALAISQTMSPYTVENYDSSLARTVLIAYMILGLLIVFTMYRFYNAVAETPRIASDLVVTKEKIKYVLRNYLSVIGLAFFFPFACILDFSHIVAAVSCYEVWGMCPFSTRHTYWIETFFHVMRILFMSSELFFCLQFHGTRFRQKGATRGALLIIMAVNVGLWFLSLVDETEERGEFPKTDMELRNNCDTAVNLTENWQLQCLNQTSRAYNVRQSMSRYLYPFTIEFLLLVGEFLAAKCFVCKAQQSVAVGQLGTAEAVDQQRPTVTGQTRSSEDRSVCFLSGLIVAVSVFASIVSIALSFDYFTDSSAQPASSTTCNAYYILVHSLLISLTVVGFVCGSAFRIKNERLRGIEWLVLMSVFGPLMYDLIHITAAARNFSLNPPETTSLFIVHKTLCLIQFILQTPFLFCADRWRLTAEQQKIQSRFLSLEKLLKTIIFCMAILNLSHWITDSILLTHVVAERNMVGSSLTSPLLLERLCFPFVIFYRFNSFLLFARAYFGD